MEAIPAQKIRSSHRPTATKSEKIPQGLQNPILMKSPQNANGPGQEAPSDQMSISGGKSRLNPCPDHPSGERIRFISPFPALLLVTGQGSKEVASFLCPLSTDNPIYERSCPHHKKFRKLHEFLCASPVLRHLLARAFSLMIS